MVSRIGIWLSVVLALACLSARPALAQPAPEISVTVQAPQAMYIGDRTDLTVQVHGSRDAAVPIMPTVPGLGFAYMGQKEFTSQGMEVENGRVKTTTTIIVNHIFTVTAKTTGQHAVPPIDVVVDGRHYTTQPVTIEVHEPKAATESSLSVVIDHKKAYVGQPIRVTLTWAIGIPVRGFEFSLPITGDAELLDGPDPRPPGTSPQDNRFLNVTLNGKNVIGRIGQTQLGDRTVNAVVVEQVIIPRSAGTIHIGPARADLNAVVGKRERQPLDSLFDDLAMTERQFVQAPALDLTVSALPAEGRPADFSGLVGSYAINAAADAKDAAVGDPITLTITVTGPFPLSLVPPLDFNAQPSLHGQFRLPRDPVLADVTPLSARFDAIIRPRTADVTEIGAIEMNYFDTDSGAYKVMATRPLPLSVRPGTHVALPDENNEPTAQPEAPQTSALPDGLAGIRREPLTTVDNGFALMHELRRPRTIAMLLAPPLASFAAFGLVTLRRRHDRDPARRRRLRAARRFRAAAKPLRVSAVTPAAVDALAHALSNFAADWADQHDDAVTASQAAEIFESSGTSSGDALSTLVRRIDHARFGATTPRASEHDNAPLPAEPAAESIRLVQQFAREPITRRAAP